LLCEDGRFRDEADVRENLPLCGSAPEASPGGDGSADYLLHYTDEARAAKRVMRYLGEAAVIEPEELRREARRRAKVLFAAHRGRVRWEL
jgi:hypothetical protein